MKYMGNDMQGVIPDDGFTIDTDANATVEDVKIQISLAYGELTPSVTHNSPKTVEHQSKTEKRLVERCPVHANPPSAGKYRNPSPQGRYWLLLNILSFKNCPPEFSRTSTLFLYDIFLGYCYKTIIRF
jgi:hypothetical protein